MTTFAFIVTVEAETYEEAQTVLSERLGHDEDYGFDYTVDWNVEPLSIDEKAP